MKYKGYRPHMYMTPPTQHSVCVSVGERGCMWLCASVEEVLGEEHGVHTLVPSCVVQLKQVVRLEGGAVQGTGGRLGASGSREGAASGHLPSRLQMWDPGPRLP